VIFFGRLEERKGLCTFVEAIRLLDSAIVPKIHLTFIGKIIPLQSSHLEHLNSQQYLDRELGNAFTYTFLPDLSSGSVLDMLFGSVEVPVGQVSRRFSNIFETLPQKGD